MTTSHDPNPTAATGTPDPTTAAATGTPDPITASADPRATPAVERVLHDRPAATLLVDRDTGTVIHANALAVELSPGMSLPVPIEEWSRNAGLRTADGAVLEDGETLAVVAGGTPVRGLEATAARGSDASAPREALWVIGIPLDDAPPPLAHQSLVILLPVRQTEAVEALQAVGDDLHARAAVASELSFTISDPSRTDDPIIWVNPAFERVTGYTSEDALGRNCRFLQGTGTDPAAVERIRSALREGRTVADTLLNYRKDGTPFWNQVVISPVLDAEGRITHHVGIQADVTERIEAQRDRDAALHEARVSRDRLQLLAQVSEQLASHLNYDDAVAALAELAVPPLADWGFVTVTSDRGRFERLHLAARDPGDAEAARLLEAQDPSWIEQSPSVAHALRSGPGHVAVPFPVDVTGLPARTTPEQLELLRRLGLGSALVVPLRARERVIGVLVLVSRGELDPEAVLTAAHVGARAGLALDNVRLYLRERAAALTLQHSLLPEIPEVAGLDLAASYLPALHRAEVGGDWFDVLPLPDGAVGLAVGDVVGHDLQAAASMGQLRSVLRSYAWSGEPAGRVMARLDELVRGLGMADVSTCVYLRLEHGRLTYSRAGHPPPLLRAGGRVDQLAGGLTTPVGVRNVDEPVEGEEAFEPGSVLVIYSDGLVERRDRSLRRGIEALAGALADLPEDLTAEEIRDALVARFVDADQEDDVCLLVIRCL